MDISFGRRRLTEAERVSHREEGRCMYCGEPGHFISLFPTKPSAGRSAPVRGLVSGFARDPVCVAAGVVEKEGGVKIVLYIELTKK